MTVDISGSDRTGDVGLSTIETFPVTDAAVTAIL